MLTIKPIICKENQKWLAKAHLFEKGFNYPISVEFFNAYNNKEVAWLEAQEQAKTYVANHNKNCKCKNKMVLGSY
tara:strand:+ start:376 stop:600 length:225 start_codon:yes stop_codon:yes gene_type:complete